MGIHWSRMDFPLKGPVTRKLFPFDDVIMESYHSALISGLYQGPFN